MKKIILLITLSIPFWLFAQTSIKHSGHGKLWYRPTDRLKFSALREYIDVLYINKYDTVPCLYICDDEQTICRGYKRVYVKRGQYIDDFSTTGILFDYNYHRIYNVLLYSFPIIIIN